MTDQYIHISGARQNNLKNLSLAIPLNRLTVVTGVSGSGKSSLAFDTVFAEGQRRYVETFSSYARQFLDRMDKPRVDRIDAIPPAVAIDQTNPVRTSRSTVGTMTELADHLKLLYARAARLFCPDCGREVRRDTPDGIYEELAAAWAESGPLVLFITFPVTVPANFSEEEVRGFLAAQGYIRVHDRTANTLEVIQDRVALTAKNRGRMVEGLEAAFRYGQGHLSIRAFTKSKEELASRHFSTALHCAHCDRHFQEATANLFSFNSPVGACASCRGFGRVIGIDFGLVVPDESLSLADGAVKPWQTASYRECQDDLLRFANKRHIPVDLPWRELDEQQKNWVMEGEGSWEDGLWYGVRRFFDWLESKSYKMHIRVLLSKYRAYHPCPACGGARLKPEALYWRLGGAEGLAMDGLMGLPVDESLTFCEALELGRALDEAAAQLLGEIRTRLRYLVEVGLGYLTLDRQSRTLSGGEVQRINLTTALGTSLTNTLFVLDEPSIGLHSRDIGRLITILQRLRDAGNTLLVVEHDPEVMRAADLILELGPGPGQQGGELVFSGPVAGLLAAPASLTGQYLAGTKTVAPTASPLPVPAQHPCLTVLGAAAHNLKGIDVAIPLGRLVCLTGVSGSGKSTLVEEVLHRGFLKRLGKPVEQPGAHRDLTGMEMITEVVLVDQSAMGKTTRSNPVSYVGAFEPIRKLFAAQPLAKGRGYTGSTFSFNAGTGRCPLCKGSGFEHVEMQFLSDVYLRCPECDGQRFRPEVLEIVVDPRPTKGGHAARRAPASIAQVLELTVAEACTFFAGEAKIVKGLAPLLEVGLGYLTLGQPLPTLSGGEAQRLKLAGHLVQKGGRKQQKILFLFDEPTTGLHFSDIATLLIALRRLVAEGHSLLVIEHNLDVIRAADWVIDLGPEGGEAGGRLVAAGTPAELSGQRQSHTGRALAAYQAELAKGAPPAEFLRAAEPTAPYHAGAPTEILIRHAREHNLRNIDVAIPLAGFTVITGVSGSGKSTVAFDILFAEGQRRYLETLNAYARQFVQPPPRPDVDGVHGVPPTVAIEQRTSRGGRKSTVATVTELYHFLRLLFTKLAVQYCPKCDLAIEPQSLEQIVATLFKRFRGKQVGLLAPLVMGRKGYYTEIAKWAAAQGISHLRVDGELTPTEPWPRLDRYREHSIELPLGRLPVSTTGDKERRLTDSLELALDLGKGSVLVEPPPGRDGTIGKLILFSTARTCPDCQQSFAEPDPRLFSFNSKRGWCPACFGTGLALPGFDEEQSGEEIWWNEWFEGEARPCAACGGARLKPEALALRWRDLKITDLTALTVAEAERFFKNLTLAGREAAIGRDLVAELLSRLGFLNQVGLGYLTLDRAAPTLSGGEAQRIRLAAQLGSNLCGVCYILDEPTIGLHPRDTIMLLDILHRLRAKGNTVVVVEHDEETIRSADRVIDLGPGGGVEGGRLVAAGTVEELLELPESITGRCLATPMAHPLLGKRRPVTKKTERLVIRTARLHNLKRLDVELPLGRLIGVSGVSGSGKSTLVRMILHENLARLLDAKAAKKRKEAQTIPLSGCDGIDGWEQIGRVMEVDQRPIGRTPRSCPATYVGLWDRIRKLFAEVPEARLRGFTAGRFSFNTADGRCPDCKGNGMTKIEMSFLPDVTVPCETCNGARFTPETLAVLFKGKSIAEVLGMNIAEAVDFFKAHTALHHGLELLHEVGLGYLTLGQQSPTLSGGEAQRIKLVTELAKVKPARQRPGSSRQAMAPHALYVLDEPTIGLHMADVEKLIRVLHRLVDAGNTVVIIEHNLDILAEADWLIDLGPEGGDGGGRIVAQGTPEQVAGKKKGSHTGRFLREILAR